MGAVGKAANEVRKALEAQIDAKAGDLAVGELNARLEQDRVDVTLPADPLPGGRSAAPDHAHPP